jgi:hypothetical protein
MKYSILALTSVFLIGSNMTAQAQMNAKPWGFTPQNRASIASLMRQVEQPPSGGGVGSVSADTIVCGAGDETAAKGNSTCIIMNNANGAIDVGQASDGDQTASNASSVNSQESAIDEIIDVLQATE